MTQQQLSENQEEEVYYVLQDGIEYMTVFEAEDGTSQALVVYSDGTGEISWQDDDGEHVEEVTSVTRVGEEGYIIVGPNINFVFNLS